MRIDQTSIKHIKRVISHEAGRDAAVRVFGSRLDDHASGGDLDLLVTVSHAVTDPAWLTARVEASVSRVLGGRKVDVVLAAPNLRRFAIHDVAEETGVLL